MDIYIESYGSQSVVIPSSMAVSPKKKDANRLLIKEGREINLNLQSNSVNKFIKDAFYKGIESSVSNILYNDKNNSDLNSTESFSNADIRILENAKTNDHGEYK